MVGKFIFCAIFIIQNSCCDNVSVTLRKTPPKAAILLLYIRNARITRTERGARSTSKYLKVTGRKRLILKVKMSPWPTMTIMCFPFSSKKLNQSKLCFVMLNLTIFVVLTCLVKYTWRKRILANIQTSGTWVHVKKVIFCNTRYPIYPMILKINRVRFGY